MRKTLLSFALATLSTASFAQVPDASAWNVGDEITDKIAWGNLSFKNDPLDYWTVSTTSGSPSKAGIGLMEVWNGTGCDVFQYVLLPKGQYRLTCQGYYRFGASEKEAESYELSGDDAYQDNALIYAQNGTYDPTNQSFTVGALRFENPLMPRLFEYKTTNLFTAAGTDEEPAWMSDQEYTVHGKTAWGPCSTNGSYLWFQDGRYMPYSDAEVTYNQVTFFVTEDSYVRVGVTKNEAKSGDSFMVTNFKMFYVGEPGAAAEFEAKKQSATTLANNLSAMCNTLVNNYEGAFPDLISAYIDDNSVSTKKLSTVEECDAAIEKLNNVISYVNSMETTYKSLISLTKQANILLKKTSYPGKAAFVAILEKANELTDPEYNDDKYTLDDFAKVLNEISEGRVTYLMSQENESGEYDFSSAINFPFFCNNEYTPVYDSVYHCYKYQDEVVINGEDTITYNLEETFGEVQEKSYKEVMEDPEHADWLPICSDVTIYENEVENQWVLKATTWHGSGVNSITMQHSYPAVGGWTASPTGNPEFLHQTITGLPEGYYAMSALMLDASGEVPSENMYAYIENTEGQREIALHTRAGKTFWWGGRDNWRRYIIDPTSESGCWDEMKTSMIYVSDGKVTIGTASDSFYASSGFRLYYYGKEIDFDKQLADSKQELQNSINALGLLGDKAEAQAIYDSIPTGIKTLEVFENAKEIIKKAQSQVKTAKAAEKEFEEILSQLTTLTVVHEAYCPIETKALLVSDPETEGLTYKGELPCKASFEALNSYYTFVDNLLDWLTSAEVAPVLAKHEADLSANYRDAETINGYRAEIEYAYHQAYFAQNKINEATEANPKDITEFIINPEYNNGTTGWSCTGTLKSDQFYNGEIYDTPEFDLNQTILGLPAGCYKLQVQAFYRDGGSVNETNYKKFVEVASSDPAQWENNNVVLYANGASTYVTSIYAHKYTERGMTKKFEGETDGEQRIYKDISEYSEDAIKSHPWDASFEIDDFDADYNTVKVALWYPNSTEGTSYRFEQSPEDYINTVYVMVEAGGKLSFGFHKNYKKEGGDWLIFDNWKLTYLGTATPDAVESVNTNASEVKAIYNAAGILTNKQVKGINIIKMTDGSVKKVAVK